MYFLKKKNTVIFRKIYPLKFWKQVNIVSGDGLSRNRRQAITWSSDGPLIATPGDNVLKVHLTVTL